MMLEILDEQSETNSIGHCADPLENDERSASFWSITLTSLCITGLLFPIVLAILSPFWFVVWFAATVAFVAAWSRAGWLATKRREAAEHLNSLPNREGFVVAAGSIASHRRLHRFNECPMPISASPPPTARCQ